MTDDKMTVLTDEDTEPSRPGVKFYAMFAIAIIGGLYLAFGPAIAAYLGF